MISSDDDDHSPPDPSSSHHHNQQQSHASVSDIDLLFKSLADDDHTNNPLPSFSIRDYVFNSRNKDIASNWPFSHKTLQFCLQNGVNNLLPPFQSLELLRNNSSHEIDHESVSVTPCANNSNPGLTLESVCTVSSRSKRNNDEHLQDLTHTNSTKTGFVSSRKTENNTTIQTTVKKCRLGAKLTEPVEEIAPNNFTVAETMASQVCPVCKTFSSSSNTTLNAHIDQCLSGESSMKWTTKPKAIVKPKIKPRKTRLMSDIYKTAPHCTVEELDARNGTSWANNSSFPAQELEFQGEEQKEEHRKTTVVLSEVADHEGDVYIDTNGTKVRILSVSKTDSSGDHGGRKLLKGGKLSKSFTGKMKNKINEDKHQHTYLKLSPNGKKLCSPKPPHGSSSEVITVRGENVVTGESCNKEDHGKGKEPMNAEVHTKLDDLPIIRPPWACSKRTGVVKKSSADLHSRHNAPKSVERSSNDTSSQQKSLKMGPSVGHYAKKRSPTLTKPSNSSHFKKESTLLHKRCEDASPSKRFKGSDFRSKDSKVSSLGKNVAVGREPAFKSNLKRKFSAVKRSSIHPLSKEKAVVGLSQDSLKQKSRVEEDDTSGKTSSESMNLLDVVRKKPENSVASRSSNGDSSGWMKNDTVDDPPCDVDSVRKETRSHRGIDVEGSTRSMASLSHDNVFDLQERNEVCQDDELCSLKHDKEMDVSEKSMHIDEVTERQHDYFDPIPLPGVPGSFLPSPGRDMVSEEVQGNSRLVTVQSISDDRHHHDSMSDSPISTISNPILARSDSDKFSVRSTSLKDDIHTKGFSMVDAINVGDWRSVKNVHQPCCCSRKEQTHELAFLRKHVVEPSNFRPQMFSQAPPSSAMKVAECDSVGSPSKPVLRLMGKNLTVVKTDEDISSFRPPPQLSHQFSSVQNEYMNFSSIGYQNPIMFNQNGHSRNTMFENSRGYADCYLSPMIISQITSRNMTPEDEAMQMGRNWSSSIPGGYLQSSQSQSSVAYNNGGSFQSFPSFMEVQNDMSKWKFN